MEGQISEKDEDFALHQLNDHCLLKVFEYLSFGDVKSLGKTSVRLKNLSMIRCHKFTFKFHSNMMGHKNGDKLLNDFLLEYGEHIRSWSLTLYHYNGNNSAEKIFRSVSVYCTNLKSVEFVGFRQGSSFVTDCQEAIDCLDNVKLLSFRYCHLLNHSDLLQRFRKLKHLSIGSKYDYRDLQIMFRNNPDIESFANYSFNGQENFIRSFNLCEFGPKFGKLRLYCQNDTVQMDLLLRLAATNLTKLTLDLKTENLVVFLTEMSKKGILKELELRRVELNRSAFDTLQSFENLELLVLCPANSRLFEWDTTLIWPRHLKHLGLNFPITQGGFISVIRQLKYLTRLLWERDFGISDLHGELENIVKERLSRPTLNITIRPCIFPRMMYIVDYQAMTVSRTNEIIQKYIEIDFNREHKNFPEAVTY